MSRPNCAGKTPGGGDVNCITQDLLFIQVHSTGNDNNIHSLTKVVYFGDCSFYYVQERRDMLNGRSAH